MTSKAKKQDQPEQEGGRAELEQDMLFGMKAICNFLQRSEPTIIKFAADYDDFPARRDNGKGWVSSRTELIKWFREYVRGNK